MKNKIIDEKLKLYAESKKPDVKLISGAFAALKEKPETAAKTFRWKRFSLAASFLAASFILFVVFASLQSNNDEIIQYRLSELNYQTLSNTEVEKESKILTLSAVESDASYRMYYSEDESDAKVITSFYKVLGQGGLDEILVVTDLQKGLADFSSFKNYKTYTSINGIPISKMEKYENGEYYINIYFEYGNVYYLKIASPVKTSAETYVYKLLTESF